MQIARRGFITGLISLVAAPAIVRVGSLMPVKRMDEEALRFVFRTGLPQATWRLLNQGVPLNDYLNDLVYHA